jgi:hypothetical protein
VQGKRTPINKINNLAYLDTVEVIGSIPVAPTICDFHPYQLHRPSECFFAKPHLFASLTAPFSDILFG